MYQKIKAKNYKLFKVSNKVSKVLSLRESKLSDLIFLLKALRSLDRSVILFPLVVDLNILFFFV